MELSKALGPELDLARKGPGRDEWRRDREGAEKVLAGWGRGLTDVGAQQPLAELGAVAGGRRAGFCEEICCYYGGNGQDP